MAAVGTLGGTGSTLGGTDGTSGATSSTSGGTSGTLGGTGSPPASPLSALLERAAAIEEELAQGQDKPFTNVTYCHGGDAAATGHQPPAFLQQVAAICTYPELMGAECVSSEAKRRAGHILSHMQGGSTGAYNLEYVTDTVAPSVARYLERRDGGITSDPQHVIPCSGTAAAMVDVMSLLVDAAAPLPTGILVPWPGPRVLAEAAGWAGAVPVPYPLAEERGWAPDLPALRRVLRRARDACHPKALWVVNPGDPTGHVLSRGHMEHVLRLVAEENLLLLVDEGQQERAFLPGRPFLSFKRVLGEMGDPPLAATLQLVAFYSLSKGLGGGGYRAGFFELVNIDPRVLKCFYTWGVSVYPPILGQLMLDTVMDPPAPSEARHPGFQEHSQRLLRALAHNARLIQEILGRAPGFRLQPLQGGSRAFPSIQLPPSALSRAQELGLEPDVFFCQELLEATGVLLAPGSEFGQPQGTHHLGVSLLVPAEVLERVLGTLTHFHTTFQRRFS